MRTKKIKNPLAGMLLAMCFALGNSARAQEPDPNFHIYLAIGQSNMAGAGSIQEQDRTVDGRFQMMSPHNCSQLNHDFGEWYPAIPPLWGCPNGGLGPSDYFGRTLVEELPEEIKIGVAVVGIPGCEISLFFKEGFEGYDTYNYVPGQYNGSAYAWILDMAERAQEVGVIKGILLHQGESNNGDREWPQKVKTVYDQFIEDLNLVPENTPLLAGELLYANQGGSTGGHNSIIATLPDVLPNSYVISADGLTGKDQFHFDTEGNREFGRRFAAQMLELYEETTRTNPTTHSAKTSSHQIFFTSSTTITAQGKFKFNLRDVKGTTVESGRGSGSLEIGRHLTAGLYFLTLESAAGLSRFQLLKNQF